MKYFLWTILSLWLYAMMGDILYCIIADTTRLPFMLQLIGEPIMCLQMSAIAMLTLFGLEYNKS